MLIKTMTTMIIVLKIMMMIMTMTIKKLTKKRSPNLETSE